MKDTDTYEFDEQKYGVGMPNHIVAATTTLVKAGVGVLLRICVNTAAAGTITIYDGLTAKGTVIGILEASVPAGAYNFGVKFKRGLCIVTAAANDLTVVYE